MEDDNYKKCLKTLTYPTNQQKSLHHYYYTRSGFLFMTNINISFILEMTSIRLNE